MPAPDSFLGQTVSHSAEHNDAKEAAATYQAAAALREAESGNYLHLARKIHDFRNTEGLAMVQIRYLGGFETKNEAFA